MTTTENYTPSAAHDIAEAFALAQLPTELSEWGFIQSRIGDNRTVRVCQDDIEFSVYVLTGGACSGEVRLSGVVANPTVLAAVISAVAE